MLIGFNLLPLVGVLFWGWSIATILVLYWVENGIVGVLNVPKMLLARGAGRPRPSGLAVTGLPGDGLAPRVGLVVFFLVHYGIFWLVHGTFVFALTAFAAGGPGSLLPLSVPSIGVGPDGFPILSTTAAGPDLAAVAFGAGGLAISHIVSFFVNFLGRREYLDVTPERQMFAPYGRLVILHLTILFGAFMSLAIGSPVGAIVVLVLLKTGLDLSLHLREHDRAASRGPA